MYHCCVHRTGSQSIRKVLAKPDVFGPRDCAPTPVVRDFRPMRKNSNYPEFRFEHPFPSERIVSPLYIGYDNFAADPKREPWRAFRRPGSSRYRCELVLLRGQVASDARQSWLATNRDHLATLDEEQGLIYSIRRLGGYGLFDALRSWIGVASSEVLLVRFEDLTGADGERLWEELLKHIDVALQPDERRTLRPAIASRRSRDANRGRRIQIPSCAKALLVTGTTISHLPSAQSSPR